MRIAPTGAFLRLNKSKGYWRGFQMKISCLSFFFFSMYLLSCLCTHHPGYAAEEQWANLSGWLLKILCFGCRKGAASARSTNAFVYIAAFFFFLGTAVRVCAWIVAESQVHDRQPSQSKCICLNWELPMGMLGAVGLSCCRLSQKCWECEENSIPMNLHLL